MAKFQGPGPVVVLSATIALSEIELRALEALAGYGVDHFLEVFYVKMGRHYLEPHEAGVRSLFASVLTDGRSVLAKVDRARDAANTAEVKKTPELKP